MFSMHWLPSHVTMPSHVNIMALLAALFILIFKELKPDIERIHPLCRLGGVERSNRELLRAARKPTAQRNETENGHSQGWKEPKTLSYSIISGILNWYNNSANIFVSVH